MMENVGCCCQRERCSLTFLASTCYTNNPPEGDRSGGGRGGFVPELSSVGPETSTDLVFVSELMSVGPETSTDLVFVPGLISAGQIFTECLVIVPEFIFAGQIFMECLVIVPELNSPARKLITDLVLVLRRRTDGRTHGGETSRDGAHHRSPSSHAPPTFTESLYREVAKRPPHSNILRNREFAPG